MVCFWYVGWAVGRSVGWLVEWGGVGTCACAHLEHAPSQVAKLARAQAATSIFIVACKELLRGGAVERGLQSRLHFGDRIVLQRGGSTEPTVRIPPVKLALALGELVIPLLLLFGTLLGLPLSPHDLALGKVLLLHHGRRRDGPLWIPHEHIDALFDELPELGDRNASAVVVQRSRKRFEFFVREIGRGDLVAKRGEVKVKER